MKIRTRLTILFTLITATILLAFASVIYISAKENREKEFYSLLKKEALTKANLFFDAKVETKTLQDIYKNNRQILNEVEVAIYDSSFNLLYHDAVDIDYVKETPEMIDEIYHKGEKQFYQEKWQVIGLRYEYENKNYIITATAIDQYGYNKLDSLLKNSIIVFVISILFIYIAGRFFSKRAFDPVKEMTEKAKVISATNLDFRLNSNGSKDELSELANTFNEMLSRLENSFDAQKNFVSNISHELRTPLAAIITELELSINKEKNIIEYKSTIQNALGDAKKLVRLSNSLLDLAKASYDPTEISFKQIRIDEILLDARQQVQQVNPDYKIDIVFENEFENDNQITVNGNEYLLKVAFANLFENGCKFSKDKQSSVSIGFEKEKIQLQFSDKGIGISEDDLKNIFTPFYRGENKQFADGNGIGLSLTQKIIYLHKGSISVQSKQHQGTTFTVELQTV
ncbi:Two-component system sensor histidine kinase [Flavobacterium indicum GPTSA100-9 = DSM 17447]|uniref:histidine kinase n=1 Tax=Flavobacterium indicum (strain DSM 17447 / CIP 109464 / GPTSA100-9) TaxID=1094466 RepID=H8XUZ7_FLAIG|nr:HAMP domain-containing sensor histidine kinase [Flavobacterium indicum]CCG52967.1 Two-component system sensor histidine kinase [Flavobacterium indicum GPTSA100-9 = DSM 17447]